MHLHCTLISELINFLLRAGEVVISTKLPVLEMSLAESRGSAFLSSAHKYLDHCALPHSVLSEWMMKNSEKEMESAGFTNSLQ